MTFDSHFFWNSLFHPSSAFLGGLGLTIFISIAAMFFALVVGLLIALMRLSRFAPLRVLAALYVWVLRGTPLLVVLVIIYLGLAAANIYRFTDIHLLGISLSGAVQAAIVGLTLNESANISEIMRAAIVAVPSGQLEAAATQGMIRRNAMRWIVIPQAIRTMIPPLGNQFNSLMKNTSLLSIIGVSEMFLITQSISSATFRTFEIFIVTAIYYLALTTVWTVLQDELERYFNRRLGLDSPGVVERLEDGFTRLFIGNRKSEEVFS